MSKQPSGELAPGAEPPARDSAKPRPPRPTGGCDRNKCAEPCGECGPHSGGFKCGWEPKIGDAVQMRGLHMIGTVCGIETDRVCDIQVQWPVSMYSAWHCHYDLVPAEDTGQHPDEVYRDEWTARARSPFPQKPARRYTNPRLVGNVPMSQDKETERQEEEVAAPEGTATLPEQAELATTDSTARSLSELWNGVVRAVGLDPDEVDNMETSALADLVRQEFAEQEQVISGLKAENLDAINNLNARARKYADDQTRAVRAELEAARAVHDEQIQRQLGYIDNVREQLAAAQADAADYKYARDTAVQNESAVRAELSSLREELAAEKQLAMRMAEERCHAQEQLARAGSLPDNAQQQLATLIAWRVGYDSGEYPGADVLAERVLERVRSWLSPVVPAAAEPIAKQLDHAVRIREATKGMPADGPYPASVGEVADEVVAWIEEVDNSCASGLVGQVFARLKSPAAVPAAAPEKYQDAAGMAPRDFTIRGPAFHLTAAAHGMEVGEVEREDTHEVAAVLADWEHQQIRHLARYLGIDHDEVEGHEVVEAILDLQRRAAAVPVEPPAAAVELIAAERRRQVEAEGWTRWHDDRHDSDEMAEAAATYALPKDKRTPRHEYGGLPITWPWHRDYYKPTPDDRIRELVKAGALIVAEIERLQRADPAAPGVAPTATDEWTPKVGDRVEWTEHNGNGGAGVITEADPFLPGRWRVDSDEGVPLSIYQAILRPAPSEVQATPSLGEEEYAPYGIDSLTPTDVYLGDVLWCRAQDEYKAAEIAAALNQKAVRPAPPVVGEGK